MEGEGVKTPVGPYCGGSQTRIPPDSHIAVRWKSMSPNQDRATGEKWTGGGERVRGAFSGEARRGGEGVRAIVDKSDSGTV